MSTTLPRTETTTPGSDKLTSFPMVAPVINPHVSRAAGCLLSCSRPFHRGMVFAAARS
jgi:hypothetical protein